MKFVRLICISASETVFHTRGYEPRGWLCCVPTLALTRKSLRLLLRLMATMGAALKTL